MSHVFVVDANRKPLDPVHPGQARLLLTQKKAAVFRRYPFTIILKTMPEHPEVHPLRLKIDPGSQTTGLPWSMMSRVKSSLRLNCVIVGKLSSVPWINAEWYAETADSARPGIGKHDLPIARGARAGFLPR
jgi:hypothetical protein